MRAFLAAMAAALLLTLAATAAADARARSGAHRHQVHHAGKGRVQRVRHVRRHRRGQVRHARARRAPRVGGLVTIKTLSGLPVRVAASAAGAFAGFLHEFEQGGYRIRFIGGYRHSKIAGTNTWSKHASGLAIDVCQLARNRVACRLPPDVTAMAARHGLLHGAVWRHPDTGHFEIPSSHYALARRGRRV